MMHLFIFIILALLAPHLGATQAPKMYTVEKESSISTTPQDSTIQKKLEDQTSALKTPFWEAPYTWQVQDLGSLRKGSWIVKKGEQKVDISVLAFPGDVGGILANVSRWAEQIQLPSLSTLEDVCTPITIDGHKAHYIALYNKQNKKGVIGAIVPLQTVSWFFKMIGDSDLLEEQESIFKAFLQTVQF